jgi:hypothetical protein
MAISQTLFGSGFQMVLAAILLKTIQKTGLFCPVFEWSSIFLPFESQTGYFFLLIKWSRLGLTI